MKLTNIYEQQDLLNFANAAAEWLKAHPEHDTFTDGAIEAGCFFAMRWGAGNSSMLVFRLDSDFEPSVYQGALQTTTLE